MDKSLLLGRILLFIPLSPDYVEKAGTLQGRSVSHQNILPTLLNATLLSSYVGEVETLGFEVRIW